MTTFWTKLYQDLPASFVVFLVALPLCMGIAIASGVPVAAGLITGIVGGLVVGWLAGCPLQVSGPAAGLTVIVYEAVQTYGLQSLGLIVLFAGLIQITAGALRLGQWFRAVSPAVIKGMLAGIGFLIMASQFHVMIDDAPKGSGAENLTSIPAAVAEIFAPPSFPNNSVRALRSQALHEIGELHRQQLQIQERLRELSEHESQPTVSGLQEQQEKVAARLREAIVPLQTADNAETASTPDAEILTAALRSCQSATEVLEVGSLSAALQAQERAVESLESLLDGLKNHQLAAYIGLLTIALIILWQTLAPKSLKVIPAPLVAILAASILATVTTLPVLYVEAPTNLLEDVRIPTVQLLANSWSSLLSTALLMAIVASAETLLCATAVDQLQHGPRTNYDRELMAQGVGNSICGLLGALPMTGVIVRSSANVQAGATSRYSAILHGMWLLLFVVGLTCLLHSIPTASLAAMLVFTGYKLVDVRAMSELRRHGWGEVAIYAATVGTIVFADLLTGVMVGMCLSAAKLLYRFTQMTTTLELDTARSATVLNLQGSATFLRLPTLAASLDQVPQGTELHVNIENLNYIDHACLELVKTWAKRHECSGGSLIIDWITLRSRSSHVNERQKVGTPVNQRLQNTDVSAGQVRPLSENVTMNPSV